MPREIRDDRLPPLPLLFHGVFGFGVERDAHRHAICAGGERDGTGAVAESVFVPMIEEARRDGRRQRLLYQLGPDFEGFTPGAVWEDARLGLRAMRRLDGCAVFTDLGRIGDTARIAAFLMPCPVKVFANSALQPAIAWLVSLPESSAAVLHLSKRGVLQIDVDHPLRAQDFDAVALLVDPWIEAHGRLAGIVIHARAFPGWENLASLLRHLRFVRDHQANVERVALAVDGELVRLIPGVAEVFVKAEVRAFGFDAVDAATHWVGGPTADAAADAVGATT